MFESAVELRWIVHGDLEDSVCRHVAQGMRNEIEMRKTVTSNVNGRQGGAVPIEDRLLSRVPDLLELAGMTESDVAECRGLPPLADMMLAVGYDRALYVATQKMSSLAVHGRWTSLVAHSIERCDGECGPREGAPVVLGQRINVLPLVLHAVADVARVRLQAPERAWFRRLLAEVESNVLFAWDRIHGADFRASESPG